MASEFINVPGPFLGTSCLRWRWSDGQSMRGTVSINVDTSRGTIKSREGFKTIKRYTNTFKVLGVRGFKTTNGEPLIAALLWDEANYKTVFNVITMDGEQVSTASDDMALFPMGHPPSPHGYPAWEDFSSVHGTSVWMTTPHGRIHQYQYDDDRLAMSLVKVNRQWSEAADKDAKPYLEVLPRATVVHSFAAWTVYAGLDGQQWSTATVRFPAAQTEMPEGWLSNTREAVRYPPNVFLVSNPGEPTNVKAEWYYDVGAGEKITAVGSLMSRMLVFTSEAVYAVDFDPAAAQPVRSIAPLMRGIGCVGHRTLCEGRGVLAWMSHDGFHMWDGNSVRKISDDIEDMFQQSGWRPSPMYSMAKNGPLQTFPWPLRISKAQLDQACGTWDHERQCFWWSVAVDGADEDDIEKSQKVCLLYYPAMDSWSIYINSNSSTLSPTCIHSFFDGSAHRLIFGDQWGGINVFGGDPSDRDKASSGADGDTDRYIEWLWQSPPLELNPNVTYRAKTLRVLQNARGYGDRGNQSKWHIETERSFDQPDGEMSFQDFMSQTPMLDPPTSEAQDHIWGTGAWESFKWHVPGMWRTRKNIHGNCVGQHFIVGFSDTSEAQRSRNIEIHSFSLEVEPKRDIT